MHTKILVTGGTALVGSALRAVQNNYPERKYIFVGSRDCDLRDRDSAIGFVRRHRPDAILHLAAVSGGIGLSTGYPATMLRDNVLMNLNILEAARVADVGKNLAHCGGLSVRLCVGSIGSTWYHSRECRLDIVTVLDSGEHAACFHRNCRAQKIERRAYGKHGQRKAWEYVYGVKSPSAGCLNAPVVQHERGDREEE